MSDFSCSKPLEQPDFSCSKPLEQPDISAFNFTKRIFGDKPTYMVNFDSIMNHPKYGYIVLEYCKVSKDWLEDGFSPWKSNPKKYWSQNKRKFLAIWEYTKAINGRLWIINYTDDDEDEGFEHPDNPLAYKDRIKIIEPLAVSSKGFIRPIEHKLSFETFQDFMITLNEECGKIDVVDNFSDQINYSELSNIEVSVSIDTDSGPKVFRERISDLYYGVNRENTPLSPEGKEAVRKALIEKSKDLNSSEGYNIFKWLEQRVDFPDEGEVDTEPL